MEKVIIPKVPQEQLSHLMEGVSPVPKFKIIKHELEVVGTNPYFTIKKLVSLFGFPLFYRTITFYNWYNEDQNIMTFPTIEKAINYANQLKQNKKMKNSPLKESTVKEIY